MVRIGIIGCGAIAQRRHVPELHANPDAEVVAIADPVAGRAAATADPIGATAWRDEMKMLEAESLDAVVVCTPNALHAPQTVEALKRGLHVLVEKPMATTRQDAKKMIAAAGRARRSLMVAMNQRFAAAHVKAREVLASGRLGRVLAFETTFKHAGPDAWSVDGAGSWFFKKRMAGMGVCGDLGVHKADLLRFLLGEQIVRVGGLITRIDKQLPGGRPINVDDNAFLTLETQSGAVGTMAISWTHYGRYEDNGTTIYCSHGVVRIGQDAQFGVMVDLDDGQKERYVTGAMATNRAQVGSGVGDAFVASILGRRKPPVDGQEGYRSLAVILSAFEAHRSGRMQRVR